MSIPVPIDKLRAAHDERGGSAYLLTVGDDARAHAVHVALRWEGDTLAADVGKRSAANAAARPTVSLLYPLRTESDYSLIVDATAVVETLADAHRVHLSPVRAVLHRSAPAPNPASPCGSDCVPLMPGPADPPSK